MKKIILVAVIIAIGYVIMHRSEPTAINSTIVEKNNKELRGLLKDLGFKELDGKVTKDR